MEVLLFIDKSKIHGKGLFTENLIPQGTEILIVGDMKRFLSGQKWITKLGSTINHKRAGNCAVVKKGDLFILVANRNIYPKEELTVNYSALKKPFINDTTGYKQ